MTDKEFQQDIEKMFDESADVLRKGKERVRNAHRLLRAGQLSRAMYYQTVGLDAAAAGELCAKRLAEYGRNVERNAESWAEGRA